MAEQWKDIPGFSDFEISSHGRVRTKERTVKANGKGTLREVPSRLIKIRMNDTGAIVSLRQDGKESTKSLKRLVWQAFGDCQITVAQKITNVDGDIMNNAIDNLSIKCQSTVPKLVAARVREQKKKDEVYVYPTIGDIYGCAKIGNRLLRMKW